MNDISKKDNELFIITQKLSLNNDIYNALKIRFDEIELKYANVFNELFVTMSENTKINLEIMKQETDNT